jgi:hypothetical protein
VDLEGLRSLVREINFNVHGVAAVVTVPGGTPVATFVVWLTSQTEASPGTLARSEVHHVMAIRRDDVPMVPRGTLVAVCEHLRTAPNLWRVDSQEAVYPDHARVWVVPVEVES